MCRYLWKTAFILTNFPFFLMFCIRYCNFLVNEIARLFLGLYVQDDIIQNNSHPKPNLKIVYSLLKNMSLCWTGAHRDTRYQKFNSFFWREVNISKKNFFDKPIWFDIKFNFFRIESIICKPFLKRLTSKYF